MQPHKVYQTAMKRGDAKHVGREMGYTSGEIPRRWLRPLATSTNLFTGELSPLMKARAELLAQDRVNPGAADILLFSLFADVARQRAERHPDERDNVVAALIAGYQDATAAILLHTSRQTSEEQLYRAGASVVRALLFVGADDCESDVGVPLMRRENKRTFVQRVIVWVRSLHQ